MQRTCPTSRILIASVLVMVGAAGPAVAGGGEDRFYKAYYLEHAKGNLEAAVRLYADAGGDRGLDSELRAESKVRLAACREELGSSDFARLMPPNTLFYAEIGRPGAQLESLLGQLGLLGTEGEPGGEDGPRVAISPALIRELLGIRGAAVAITGVDLMKGKPAGVVVFHPGNLEVIRGLIETALPAGGKSVEPIQGYPTYDVEGQAIVTLTSRLVVAGTNRAQVEGVLKRLSGKEKSSLATSGELSEVMKDRDDNLLFFCVNAKPILPLINGLLAASGSREIAMARVLLDPESFHSLSGRAGVDDDGLFFDIALRLDEGHHNLIYNFLRTPAINRETLKSIPAGVAGFIAGALNEAPSRFTSTSGDSDGSSRIVTALDIGREIFANVISFAVFAMPPDDASEQRGPIPDVAAVITVNDPGRSEALWTQVLGIASLAAGGRSFEGSAVTIDGTEARAFQFDDKVTIYFATVENNVLIATSESAVARTIRARSDGKSILNDPAFAASLERMTPTATKAVFVHPGRCFEIAKQFMNPSEIAEAAPFVGMLSDTVASLVVDHSDQLFRLSVSVTDLPQIGGILSTILTQHLHQNKLESTVRQAMDRGQWNKALAAAEKLAQAQPASQSPIRTKFRVLAVGKKDRAAALECGEHFLDTFNDDAGALNNFAWNLLTSDQYELQYSDLALRMSKRSNEITQTKNWAYVDTLALARFETGDVQKAIDLEQKAIELCDGPGADGLNKALARFEEALQSQKLAAGTAVP